MPINSYANAFNCSRESQSIIVSSRQRVIQGRRNEQYNEVQTCDDCEITTGIRVALTIRTWMIIVDRGFLQKSVTDVGRRRFRWGRDLVYWNVRFELYNFWAELSCPDWIVFDERTIVTSEENQWTVCFWRMDKWGFILTCLQSASIHLLSFVYEQDVLCIYIFEFLTQLILFFFFEIKMYNLFYMELR